MPEWLPPLFPPAVSVRATAVSVDLPTVVYGLLGRGAGNTLGRGVPPRFPTMYTRSLDWGTP